jgi:dipeptidase E
LRAVNPDAIAQVEDDTHMIDVDAGLWLADEHDILDASAPVRRFAGARLVALGGGGATHGLDAPIDDFVLQHLGVGSPRVGFLDWARPDRAERLQRLRERLAGRCAGVDTLPLDAGSADAARWLGGLDLLYVGGGDTARLLDALRHTPAGQAVVDAARAGLLLVGVSAGASVWFDCALSDAGGRGLRRLDGLCLLAGSFCPHFDTEPERRPAFAAAIARAQMPPGLAVDDGAAVLCTADGAGVVCAGRAGAGAWSFRAGGDVEQIRPNTGFLG